MNIKDRTPFHFAIDRLSKNSMGYHVSIIDLGKNKKKNFKINFLPRGSTKYLLEVKKYRFFITLNVGVDQNFGTFYLTVLFLLSCA